MADSSPKRPPDDNQSQPEAESPPHRDPSPHPPNDSQLLQEQEEGLGAHQVAMEVEKQEKEPEVEVEKPADKTDVLGKKAGTDQELEDLDAGWLSTGSVYDEDNMTSGVSRFSCNIKNGTLNGQPFKNFWTSKQRCANLLELGETTFTEFLVENKVVQAIVEEYFEHVPRTNTSDTVRGDSFQHLFEMVKNDQHVNYTAAHKITLSAYNTEDWTIRYHAQLFHELRNANEGFLNNVSGSDEAIWAITYCVAKLVTNYNRDEKKKLGAKKSVITQKAKAKSGRKRVKAKYDGFQLLGPNMVAKTATPKTPAKKLDKKDKPMGVGMKPPRQPPKGVDSGPKDPDNDGVDSGPKDPDNEDGGAHETEIRTDYAQLTPEVMMGSFVGNQDGWEDDLRKKYEERILRHARDLEKCMEDLRQNDGRNREYKLLSRVLRETAQRLFSDFRHTDVKDLRLEAMRAMGTPDDIHQDVPNTSLRENGPDEEAVNEALASEDAVLHEERQVRARAQAQTTGKVVHLDLPVISEKHREITRKWTSMLNSPDFQPDYIKDACIQIDIRDFRFKVIPRQNPTLHMRWWQVINVKWNHDHASGLVEGVIGGLTADVVGSGKTIEMGGTILHDMNIVDGIVEDIYKPASGSHDTGENPLEGEAMDAVQTAEIAIEKGPSRDTADGTDADINMPDAIPDPVYVRPPPKESNHKYYLVLTNPGLVNQTSAEFAGFSSTFRVVALGGTKRRVKDGRRVRSTLGGKEYFRANNLEDPNYFNPDEKETSHTVAVASYLWFARKYGPKAYHKWLITMGKSNAMPVPPHWDKTPESGWARNLKGYIRAALFDEAADGLRNQSTFWFAAHYTGALRKWLFTGSPAPRGIKDYASYLELIQAPGFNELAKRHHPDIGYRAGKTDPYELDDEHPAAKFRAAHYCFEKFVLNADLDEYARGIKAQKCLRLWVIRRDHQSACPRGSNNTMARSLPPKDHFILEKLLDPTGLRYYTRFSQPWSERLMLMRKNPDRPEEEGTPTPNGRSIRAMEMLSFFWPLGFLHKDLPVPKDVRDKIKKGIYPEDRSILNRDRESFFWDKSPIYQKMPKLSRKEPGRRLRWLFKTIQEHEQKKKSKDQVFADYDFDNMPPKKLAGLFLTFSPKMAAVVSLIQHHAVLRDEKMILWFQYPFNQELAQDVLHCLKIFPMAMYKESSAFSRDEIQRKFNDPKNKTRILLCGIRVGGTGLNFQWDSHIAAAIDAFISMDQEVQTGGRQHRNGQVIRCIFYQIIVGRTHDMRILQENIQKSIASTTALMGSLKDIHDPDDIIPHLELQFANNWETGYFASMLKRETTAKAFHLATQSGQQRIEDVRKEVSEDWEHTCLDPDAAIALMSIQHRTQFVKWHGSSNGTMSLAALVDQELEYRKQQRQLTGEISEDDIPREKKTRRGRKKKARDEGSTQVDAPESDDDGDYEYLSDVDADKKQKSNEDSDLSDVGNESNDEEGDENAEQVGLDEQGFAPDPEADADDEDEEDGPPVRNNKKRNRGSRSTGRKDKSESGSDTPAQTPRKKSKKIRLTETATPADDTNNVMDIPIGERQDHLRDNDDEYPGFPDWESYSTLSSKEKRESTLRHKAYAKKWQLPEYKAPKKR